jgi:hypothetical protein
VGARTAKVTIAIAPGKRLRPFKAWRNLASNEIIFCMGGLPVSTYGEGGFERPSTYCSIGTA